VPPTPSPPGNTGERIVVGCKNGEVLQLTAHWLVQPCETENMFVVISRHVHFS
jgi:hypothetical protein